MSGETEARFGQVTSGRVTFYSVMRQFGFVETDDGRNVFMHHSAIVYNYRGPGTYSPSCCHNRGMCVRALSLLPNEQQAAALHEFTTVKLERLLAGVRVTLRIVEGDRGLEARAVKREKR
ncbi:MAG TPA: hypothetical protein VGR34_06545 [Candidatus Dormibacteraeota bacterium]|nr:hypothetical protein [Candidatus Dormibacteraeota bacterium]